VAITLEMSATVVRTKTLTSPLMMETVSETSVFHFL